MLWWFISSQKLRGNVLWTQRMVPLTKYGPFLSHRFVLKFLCRHNKSTSTPQAGSLDTIQSKTSPAGCVCLHPEHKPGELHRGGEPGGDSPPETTKRGARTQRTSLLFTSHDWGLIIGKWDADHPPQKPTQDSDISYVTLASERFSLNLPPPIYSYVSLIILHYSKHSKQQKRKNELRGTTCNWFRSVRWGLVVLQISNIY